MRSTSKNVFISLVFFVDVPARRKSWELCNGMPGFLGCRPGEASGDSPCFMLFLMLRDPWKVGGDRVVELSMVPRRCSGRPNALASIGQTGRSCHSGQRTTVGRGNRLARDGLAV
ncbi:hypothetical protein HYQ46_013100 [Verticillium longisporum]|nr:hypothetical protein HYQ46_013100 [Verticillium longisporum]